MVCRSVPFFQVGIAIIAVSEDASVVQAFDQGAVPAAQIMDRGGVLIFQKIDDGRICGGWTGIGSCESIQPVAMRMNGKGLPDLVIGMARRRRRRRKSP
jgi:hypothetical protein